MEIITWNVNWIRAAARKGLKNFIKNKNPDILCIQELKAFEEQFLKEVWEIEWYKYVWNSSKRPWYSGTAIFYKQNIKILNSEINFDNNVYLKSDWRLTKIEFENFILLNWYFPNWWTRANWTEMLSYKLNFYDEIIKYINFLTNSWKNIILTWDLNICHTEIDIARPKENQNSIWFLPIEREKFSQMLKNWYLDVFRYFYPETKEIYSWWSYRAKARERNIWWRLDYFIVNKNFINKIKDIKYLTDVEWSDHCPVFLKLK